MYHVYIVRCSDGTFYVGHTNDLEDRTKRHNDGTAAAYTRVRRPVVLVYNEPHTDETSAVRRELQIKNWSHAKKDALVQGDKDELRRLSH